MENRPVKIPSPVLSFVPVAVLVGLLFFTIRIFGSNTLDGASQMVLLLATAVCVLIAMTYCRVSWTSIEAAIVQNIKSVTTALLILLVIGALSGSWMVSGIIPTLIYYGMQIIRPDIFLVSTCLICILVSVLTGSSWTTIATVGIALYGIGKVHGFGDGWIAGAIISGAYFGDKMSPLSDTTVLASSITDTPLFKHVQYMMITTVPSIVIALAIFLVAGFMHSTASEESVLVFTQRLDATFRISLWLLIVPLAMGVLIARRVPALVTLFISALLAGIFALFFQPGLLHEIAETETKGVASVFEGLLRTFYGSTAIETGDGMLNELVKTRGMAGMTNTVWLIICAMCFGGAMTASNMLVSITSVFLLWMKRTAGLVASTVFSGIFLNICMSDQYLSIILTGNMFKHIYKQKGYESRLLSRTLEDGITVTSPLVPWNTCGMTQAAVLGVSTLTYLPYCFFNIISPLMSILVAMTGYKIITGPPREPDEPGNP
ncbi:MAG: sodium:proton antiporter [Dysgonamonadaceae bacterium]|nr:sodium:proton antiporter [Dysgonamonadaceae bacterium]